MSTHRTQTDSYLEGNIRAAEIIAADPTRYPGLMQEWAARVLAGGANIRRELEGRAGVSGKGEKTE
jgi:hypothetical protein